MSSQSRGFTIAGVTTWFHVWKGTVDQIWVDQIWVVRQLVEKAREHDTEMHFCIVDLIKLMIQCQS